MYIITQKIKFHKKFKKNFNKKKKKLFHGRTNRVNKKFDWICASVETSIGLKNSY